SLFIGKCLMATLRPSGHPPLSPRSLPCVNGDAHTFTLFQAELDIADHYRRIFQCALPLP
ncbi:MAG: hypothetical protein N6V49_03440, partial [Serratia symbiotica]|nr:hypothetical protein [Serratia symbiotica]